MPHSLQLYSSGRVHDRRNGEMQGPYTWCGNGRKVQCLKRLHRAGGAKSSGKFHCPSFSLQIGSAVSSVRGSRHRHQMAAAAAECQHAFLRSDEWQPPWTVHLCPPLLIINVTAVYPPGSPLSPTRFFSRTRIDFVVGHPRESLHVIKFGREKKREAFCRKLYRTTQRNADSLPLLISSLTRFT